MSKPSAKSIRTFACVSEHLSFKIAAEELGVTPTAISHQIRNLEQQSGERLLNRSAAGITHTVKGQLFADAVVPAIKQIERAYDRLVQNSEREKIVLGAGPVVASRWLAPRLPEFSAKHPEVDLQIINSPTEIWERAREFDLAIAWGDGNWPGLVANRLLKVHLVPVMAPALAEALKLQTPADLLHAPLLHHRTTAEWMKWFQQCSVEVASLSGTSVDDTNVAVQATLAGTGVMLGVREFLSDDISAGRLVSPFSTALKPTDAYFLVRASSAESQKIEQLASWLVQSAG